MALCCWPCFTLDSTPALSSSLQWENVLELRTNKQNVLTLIHMIQGGQWLLLSWYMAHSSYVVNMENWYHCCQGIFNSSMAWPKKSTLSCAVFIFLSPLKHVFHGVWPKYWMYCQAGLSGTLHMYPGPRCHLQQWAVGTAVTGTLWLQLPGGGHGDRVTTGYSYWGVILSSWLETS